MSVPKVPSVCAVTCDANLALLQGINHCHLTGQQRMLPSIKLILFHNVTITKLHAIKAQACPLMVRV
jgi:hypothetical protein